MPSDEIRTILKKFQQDSLQNFLALKDTDLYIDQALASIREVIRKEKKNTCDDPVLDMDGFVDHKCGGCFPCSYDQTIDHLTSLFGKES